METVEGLDEQIERVRPGRISNSNDRVGSSGLPLNDNLNSFIQGDVFILKSKQSASIESVKPRYEYKEVPLSPKKFGSEAKEMKRSFYEMGSMKRSFREIDLRGSSVRYFPKKDDNKVYTKTELLHIVQKVKTSSAKLKTTRDKIIELEYSGLSRPVLKELKKLEKEQMKHRDRCYDLAKLRRNIIKGIPCNYLNFKEVQIENRIGSQILEPQFVFLGLGPTLDHPRMNLRRDIWMIICKIEDIMHSEVMDYVALYKKRLEDAVARGQQPPLPVITTAEDLYHFYRKKFGEKLADDLRKDVPRSDPGNDDFKIDPDSGENALYNLLNAYGHFDSEIQYCQGMNIVVAWILKFMQVGLGEYRESGEEVLKYDEVNAFFIFVYMMKKLEYRHVYDDTLSKLHEHLQIMEENLQTSFPEIYKHMTDVMMVNLDMIFTNIITTIFIADLQQVTPNISVHIFDIFLIDGESLVFNLLMQFIRMKENEILKKREEDLLMYMRFQLPIDCLLEMPMHDILEFECDRRSVAK